MLHLAIIVGLALGLVGKAPGLGDATSKISSECSCTGRKLRFLADFLLASPSLGGFSNKP